MTLRKIGAAVLVAALSVGRAYGQVSNDVVKIGIMTDMTGLYSAASGMGMVRAVELAVKDFGGKVLGKPIEIVSADFQHKVDIAVSKARQWYDVDGVDIIIEASDSAAAIAMQRLAAEKKKLIVFAGSGTSALTQKECSPYGMQWSWDTYAVAAGTARALVKNGGTSWYFLTVDYAMGQTLERDTTEVVKALGGTVLGTSKHPMSASDFASFLLQAQASKAKVVGMANAGKDLQNAVRQAAEFGLPKNQTLAALMTFDTDIKGLGLQAAQGLVYTTAFYWDRTPETRAFAKRFYEVHKSMPTMSHAAAYSSAMHFLKAVAAAKTDASDAVNKKMRETPVNDFFATGGKIRVDGRMVHDMYLAEVKKPSESKGEWDLVRIKYTIPGDEAFRPLSQSECPLVKH